MKDTLLVNLYAGPGSGKSTGAAYIFSKLKMAGIDCELVTEYAKDRVWQDDQFPLQHCQLYVTGKQALKIARVLGKVDVIVTDSPIMMGAMYTDEQPHKDVCIYEGLKYKNTFNIYVDRKKRYVENGRNQTEAEARQIDREIIDMLDRNGVEYIHADGTEYGYSRIVDMIIEKLGKEPEYSPNTDWARGSESVDMDADDTVTAAWQNVPMYTGYCGETSVNSFKIAQPDRYGIPVVNEPESNTIYLVKDQSMSGESNYQEWVWHTDSASASSWQHIGNVDWRSLYSSPVDSQPVPVDGYKTAYKDFLDSLKTENPFLSEWK